MSSYDVFCAPSSVMVITYFSQYVAFGLKFARKSSVGAYSPYLATAKRASGERQRAADATTRKAWGLPKLPRKDRL